MFDATPNFNGNDATPDYMKSVVFIDYHISKKCKNLLESYGEICVKCGKCGRNFNKYGVLIK